MNIAFPISRAKIIEGWKGHGLYCNTYSPGDGMTRYRFTLSSADDYFGPGNGIYTALGWKEANVFAAGFILAKQRHADPAARA